jgi:hypothetical protein
MKFELEENNCGMSDEELLDDLRRCAKALSKETITRAEYEEIGKVHPGTIVRRFGSWTNALARAGLQPSRSKIGITDEELFENIKSQWIRLGRQPRYAEVKKPASKYCARTYESRFGTWTNSLKAFVAWVNSEASDEPQQQGHRGVQISESGVNGTLPKRRSPREISERQRFRILVRDGFRCVACGVTPLTQRGVELHVDHIVPWSKGGETVDDNLETKCKRCNLGKGNAFEV